MKLEELLREMVDLRRKALIEALPEQNGLKAWVSVRRFNPSGKSSFNHDRPANWQGISSMPGPFSQFRYNGYFARLSLWFPVWVYGYA